MSNSGATIPRTNEPPQNALAAQLFRSLDRDGNNVVTEEEFFGPHEKRFDALDTNHDRQLSQKEFEAGTVFGQPGVQTAAKAPPQNPLAAQLFRRLDRDGNNLVTEDEFFGPYEKQFDSLDSNHDGQLSQKEFEARSIFGQPVVQGK